MHFFVSESNKTGVTAAVLPCPSYLQAITRSNRDVYLIYDQEGLCEIKVDKVDETVNDTNLTLDLTGNPLKVDLDGEAEVVVDADVHLWSDDENRHFPLELKIARNKVNNILSSPGENEGNNYVYAICRTKGKNRQVLLGARQYKNVFSRVQVFVEGVYTLSDERISMNSMKIEHCKNAQIKDCDVDTLITATYSISGQRKSSSNVQFTSGHSGSILLEISWTTPQYFIPDYEKSINMDIQIIVGHRGSQLNIIWEQLLLLESLIARKSKFEDIVLSDDPTNVYDVTDAICELVDSCKILKPRMLKDNEVEFKIYRDEEFTDILWGLLTKCGSVDDVRICLHNLFKVLVESESSLELHIPFHNTSCIARIIQEIAAGKLAVPTLSHAKALECLIELGIERLKSDYFHILSISDCLSIAEADHFWKSLTNSSSSVLPNDLKRRTMLLDSTIVDNVECLTKLKCLLKLHAACDALVLAKACNCLPQVLTHKIKNSLISDTRRMEGKFAGVKGHTYEVSVQIERDDLKDIKLDVPIAWNVRLESSVGSSSVKTIFNHSIRPIFPPVIFDAYELPLTSSCEFLYYVYKLVEYSERL